MTSIRLRLWGSDEWSYLTIHGELEGEILSILGSRVEGYHVQLLEDGEWGDLDA